jgi:2-pyrone-4,6-dicarboxylate lactonase
MKRLTTEDPNRLVKSQAPTTADALPSRMSGLAGATPQQDSAEGRTLPVGACDCHAHVYGPFVEYPLPTAVPFKPPLASIEALEGLWEAFGIERDVIVQGSAYGDDHSALLAAIRRAPENRRGIALVRPDTPDPVLDQLQTSGVRGARLNSVRHLGNGFDETRCREVVRRIEPFGWHLELHVDAEDLERLQRLVHESLVAIVIDHMGRVDATLGLSQSPFQSLLKLISSPHCWVKLSGADRLAKQPNPDERELIPAATCVRNELHPLFPRYRTLGAPGVINAEAGRKLGVFH